MDLGKQYLKDYPFRKKARIQQSEFRAKYLKVDCDEYGNMLKKEDAEKGLNFYSDFDIFSEVYNRFGKTYKKQLYANMLRSEHIPFNLFIPLKKNKEFAIKVLNELFDNSIQSIKRIEVEYAPKNKAKYLDDRTAFDTYIEYIHKDDGVGVLGIEVKYTELSYILKNSSKEKTDVENPDSLYWQTTLQSGVFKKFDDKIYASDNFRQIWRNHLLGEKLVLIDKIKHFTSVTIYPKGNLHFNKVLKEYQEFLKIPSRIKGITFEEIFSVYEKYSDNEKINNWINYLKNRYLINE